jgi:hypothetical protein
MTQIVVGKALDSTSWIRSEQAEYVNKPMLGDVIQFEDTVYRVAGGNGWKPVQLWYIDQEAVNDDFIEYDAYMASVEGDSSREQ